MEVNIFISALCIRENAAIRELIALSLVQVQFENFTTKFDRRVQRR